MRAFARSLLLVVIAVICSAHIGSPDAWYNGAAGPYHVLVHVKAPAVVPGIAIINIKPDEPVDTVTAFVNKYDATEGAPPPDVARPTPDQPGWFRTQLWVMDPGSNSVTVRLHGGKGDGVAVVPLVAVAARRLTFDKVLTVLLGAAALILVAGLLTIVGAAVRESVLPPGTEPDTSRRKRARFAMLRGGVAIIAVVSGLAIWWRAEDNAFAQNMFRPLAVAVRVDSTRGSENRLTLTITDSVWTERNKPRRVRFRGGTEFTTLVADHDKLMHMFVIAENGQSNFAHLHPVTTDSVSFTATLPPLPAGRYRVFADVLHESGMTQTLTSSIVLGVPSAGAGAAPTDSDDAWIANAMSAKSNSAQLADGSTVTWLGANAPHLAGEEAQLRFSISPAEGDTGKLQPYLGMTGHAAVVRDDGSVFIHLHPMGTVSMGAQRLLTGGAASPHNMMAMSTPSAPSAADAVQRDTLYFPYAFPTAGRYTVWIQMRRHDRVQTASFPVEITDRQSGKSP